jgi:hypothetical protein
MTEVSKAHQQHLTEEDAEAFCDAYKRGEFGKARSILENRGLKWLGSWPPVEDKTSPDPALVGR